MTGSMHSRGQDMLLRRAAAQGDLVSGVIEHNAGSIVNGQRIADWQPFGVVNVISCQPFNTTSNSLEVERALAIATEVTVIVVCTYLDGVTNSMRIVVGDRTFYIGYTRNVRNLGKILNLYCGETLPA